MPMTVDTVNVPGVSPGCFEYASRGELLLDKSRDFRMSQCEPRWRIQQKGWD